MPRAKLRLTVPEGVWVGDLSRAHPDVVVRVLAALPGDDERGVGLAEVVGEDAPAVADGMWTYDGVVDLEVLERADGRALVQFETSNPVLLLPVRQSGVPLELPFDIRDGEALWEVTAPQRRLSELGRQLDAFDVQFDVEWVQQALESDGLLTDRQRELLEAAREHGYYDTPRRCSLTELADSVGIAKSTCSETLHRAEAKVVSRHLDLLVNAGGAVDVSTF